MSPSDGGILLILFASVLGGTLGARMFGGLAWKGAVSALGAIAPAIILVFTSSREPEKLYIFLLELVGFIIACVVVRLSYDAAKGAFLGNLLFSLIAVAVVASVDRAYR